MRKEITDYLGQVLSVGDFIVYPTCSSSPNLVGPVRILSFKTIKEWGREQTVAQVLGESEVFDQAQSEWVKGTSKRRFDSFHRCIKVNPVFAPAAIDGGL